MSEEQVAGCITFFGTAVELVALWTWAAWHLLSRPPGLPRARVVRR